MPGPTLRSARARSSPPRRPSRGRAAGRCRRRRSSAPRRRASATTRRTPRCCWRRGSGRRRATSPDGWPASSSSCWAHRCDRVEVAGPGFLNLFLADRLVRRQRSAHVLAAGEAFGGAGADPAERVDVEFVSANPTGPMTAAGGRHAAYGDALARLLEFAGHDVKREYYVNDFGGQVRRLGESIQARARGEAVPEGGYEGDYVLELADADSRRRQRRRRGRRRARRAADARADPRVDAALRRRVRHVVLRGLAAQRRADGGPARVRRAAARGEIYRSDGALWLRSDAHGDDKTACCERSTGEHTYFASDIAYHLNKLERGFDRLIDVWGADHHGYVSRMHAAFAALGAPDGLDGADDHAVRQPRRARRARRDVQAPRRLRDARRPGRADRLGRGALLHAAALARHDGRPRPRPRARAVHREPGLLRPVRARPDRVDPEEGGGARGRRGARGRAAASRARSSRPSARWSTSCSRSPTRSPRRRSGGRRTGSPPTPWSSRRRSRPSTATATSSVPRARASRPSGSALSVATKRAIARSLDLLGVSAPEQMSREAAQPSTP